MKQLKLKEKPSDNNKMTIGTNLENIDLRYVILEKCIN